MSGMTYSWAKNVTYIWHTHHKPHHHLWHDTWTQATPITASHPGQYGHSIMNIHTIHLECHGECQAHCIVPTGEGARCVMCYVRPEQGDWELKNKSHTRSTYHNRSEAYHIQHIYIYEVHNIQYYHTIYNTISHTKYTIYNTISHTKYTIYNIIPIYNTISHTNYTIYNIISISQTSEGNHVI